MITLYSPLHITAIEDIYMARYQIRLFKLVKSMIGANLILSIDCDKTGKFNELVGDTSGIALIDLRHISPTGIVEPTKRALAISRELGSSHLLRVTMDTQITDIDCLVKFISASIDFNGLIGSKDTCSNIKGYLAELGIPMRHEKYDFVQGNFIYGPMEVWELYGTIPMSVKHYCDDSVLSFLAEHHGYSLKFVNNFWHHNRTKNVLYLESLYAPNII